MLSIGSVSSPGAASTYFAKDNYYTKSQGLGPSEWFGKGSSLQGLGTSKTDDGETLEDRQVDAAEFKAVLEGRISGTEERVGRMSKDGEWQHMPAKDFVFSPSKSVSVMALVAGDERIVQAHQESVKETLALAEREYASVRDKQKDGSVDVRQTGNITAALFTHDTSRNQDPLLHVHAVIANVTHDPERKEWRALNMQPLFKNRLKLSKLQDSILESKIKALGYTTERIGTHGKFEITSVPKGVIKMFSTRRDEIEAHLKEGQGTWDERQTATYMTRERKVEMSRDELTAHWRDQAEGLGFKAQDHIPTAAKDITPARETRSDMMNRIIDDMTHNSTTLAHVDLVAAVHADPNNRMGISSIERNIDTQISSGGLILHSKDQKGNTLYTTREQIRAEKSIIAMFEAGRGRAPLSDKKEFVREKLSAVTYDGSRRIELNSSQAATAEHILTTDDKYIGVQGRAGTGKTFMLGRTIQTLQDARALSGQEPIKITALAPTKAATAELGAKTGTESHTVQHFLTRYGYLAGETKPTERDQNAHAGSALVVDESSMLSHRMTEKLMIISEKLGIEKVIMVGDTAQHGAIQAGASFHLLQKNGLKTHEMADILRQKNGTLLRAATQVSQGQFRKAFRTLDRHIHESDNFVSEATEKYLTYMAKGEDALLIAPDNITRKALNANIRERLTETGHLGAYQVTHASLTPTYLTPRQASQSFNYGEDDTLLMDRDIHSVEIEKGELWIVKDINHAKNELTIQHGDRRLTWNLRQSKTQPFQHFKSDEIKLSQKDQIRFKAASKTHDVERDQVATIMSISGNIMTCKMKDGRIIRLNKQSPLARMIDHAYASTSYGTQGLTSPNVVAAIQPKTQALSQQAMTVISTRGEHNYDIFTPSKKDMIDQVMSNPGSDRIATQLEGHHDDMFRDAFKDIERIKEQVPDIVRERSVDHSAGI